MESYRSLILDVLSAADQTYPKVARCIRSTRATNFPLDLYNLDLICRSIRDISASLYRIHITLSGMAEDDTVRDDESFNLCYVHRADEVIRDLAEFIDTGEESRGVPSWPFNEWQTKALKERVGQLRARLIVACAADTPFALLRALSQPSRQPMSALESDVAAHLPDRVPHDQSRQLPTVRGIPDPAAVARWSDARLNTYLRLRTPGTLDSTLQKPAIESWLGGRTSKVWLRGGPGSGKSVLASTIVEKLIAQAEEDPTTAVCYHFFEPYGRYPQKWGILLAGLVGQLAQQHPEAWSKLKEILLAPAFTLEKLLADEDAMRKDLQERSTDVGFLRHAFDCLKLYYKRVYLVVDGHFHPPTNITDTLNGLCPSIRAGQAHSPSISIMACEPSSVDSNPQSASYLVTDVTPDHSQIEAYVREHLQRHAQADPSRGASTEEAKQMVETISWSTRRFDVAGLKTDLTLLMGPDASTGQEALRPPHGDTGLCDLYKTYASALYGQEKQLALDVLHLLQVVEPDQLSMQQMCHYVSLSQASGVESWGEVAMVSEPYILRICGPLVRRTVEGPTIELSHRVIRELFPADEPNVRLHISLVCLRLLNFQDFSHPSEGFHIEMAKTGNRKPDLYSYAAETWMDAELGPNHDKIPGEKFCSEALVLFKSVRSGNFISWLTEMGRRRLEGLYSLPSPQTFLCLNTVCTKSNLSPLHYAACFGLTDVCHSLIIRKHSVNETSELGTPLYCALAGPALLLSNILDLDWAVARKDYRLRQRFATADKLLEMGALAGKHNNMLPRRCTLPSFAAVALMACAARSGPHDCQLFATFCPDEQHPSDPDFFALFQHAKFPYDPMEPDNGSGPPRPQYRAFLDDLCAMLMDLSWKHGRRAIRNAIRDKSSTYGLKKCLSPKGAVQLTDDSFNDVVLEAVDTAFGVEEKWMRADLEYLMNDARFSVDLPLRDQPSEDAGRTLLHEAVEHDSIYWVDRFLELGADVAVADASGRTPLHLCESSNVLRLLARHGANLRQTDNEGRLLWHYAAANNDIRLLRTLLKLDPDKEWVFKQVTKQNRTPLAEAFAYIGELNGLPPVPRCQYAEFLNAKTQSIRFILASLDDLSSDYLCSDVPVICRAAEWGQVNIVRALSSFRGLQTVKDGRNALHYLNFYASAALIREIRKMISSLDEHPLDNQGRSPAETIFPNFKPRTFEGPRDNAHPANNADLDRAAYMELLTDSVCKTRDSSDRTLWERFSDVMGRYVQGEPWPRVGEGLVTAVTCMVERGVVHEYESYTGLCAFTELARRFWDIWRVMGIERVPYWLARVYVQLVGATSKIQLLRDDPEFDVFFPTAHPGYTQICGLIEARTNYLARSLAAAAEEPGRGDHEMADNS